MEEIQRWIEGINAKPQISVECNFTKMSALEAAIKGNINLSTAQEEIWSEFMRLNKKNSKSIQISGKTARPIHA